MEKVLLDVTKALANMSDNSLQRASLKVITQVQHNTVIQVVIEVRHNLDVGSMRATLMTRMNVIILSY